MKTLVLFGAARKNGNTRALLDAFLEEATGQVDIIDAYRTKDVSPCIDCRFCWKKRECSIKDGMQEIYRLVDEADRFVLAAPLYFHSVPGPMKSIIDRFQMYWAGTIRKDRPSKPTRKGAILLCGGAPSFPNQFTAGELVLKGVLNDLSATCVGMVTVPQTDKFPVSENNAIQDEARKLARELYKGAN